MNETQVLRKGVDIMEVDTWGMDCYSRQNVYDAILDVSPDMNPKMVREWFDRTLSPVIQQQRDQGWNLGVALKWIETYSCPPYGEMARFVRRRLESVGEDYFRIHPKGTGVICIKDSGIPAFTLVEEYLGVIHAPWRWFEIQDILKRQSMNELPDFYNIVLERPSVDPAGYDVTFVDAASKGTFAGRMSHSCDPNCQLTVIAVNGRLTIAMYTTKEIHQGQELTFDYASVTESEKEYRSAICLCASPLCRGSFLYYGGSGAFMQIMSCGHNFLHRNAILVKAATEPLTLDDQQRLDVNAVAVL